MSWLEFISKIVAALAWPAAVVILGVMFKGKLEQLLDKVKRAKGAGFEFDFISVEARAEAAKELVKEELRESSPPSEEPVAQTSAAEAKNTAQAPVPERPKFSMIDSDATGDVDHLLLMELNPSALILSAWMEIERQLLDFVKDRGVFVSTPHTRSPAGWLHAIQQEGALPKNLIDSIRELYQLRNRVAHADSWVPEKHDAKSYFNAVKSVIDSIKEIQKHGGNLLFRDHDVEHIRPKGRGDTP